MSPVPPCDHSVQLCPLCPLCSMCLLVFPVSVVSLCVPLCPLCLLFPFASPVSLVSPVYPCGMSLHFLRRRKLGCRFKSRCGYFQFFFCFFFSFIVFLCLVVVRCTSKTRKNIYLNCLPMFSKYIHSNNCFVEFRIS